MRLCEKCIGAHNPSYTELYLEQNVEYCEYITECPVCGAISSLVNIDDIIAPIITTFWEKGYHTVASCGGHQPSYKLLPGHYHKMYVTFDLSSHKYPHYFVEALINFCKNNDNAYLKADPTGEFFEKPPKIFHLGLFITAETYQEHLKNVSSLLNFAKSLAPNIIRSTDTEDSNTNESRSGAIRNLFRYKKFFYDIPVNHEDGVGVVSFNFTGIYLVNIRIESTLMQCNRELGEMESCIIATIMQDYPISDMLKANEKPVEEYTKLEEFYKYARHWFGYDDQVEFFDKL